VCAMKQLEAVQEKEPRPCPSPTHWRCQRGSFLLPAEHSQ